MPIRLTPPYLKRGYKQGECPVMEEALRQFIARPLLTEQTDDAVDYMAGWIIELSQVKIKSI